MPGVTTPLLVAGGVYALLALGLLIGEGALLERLRHVPVSAWIAERVGLPLARAALVIAFVLLAYPAIFGLDGRAPPLGEVLAAEGGRLHVLLNGVFAAGVLLPLVPVLGAVEALVLPVQGAAAATLLFGWTAVAAGAPQTAPWAGWAAAAALVLIAAVGHRASLWAGARLGPVIDRRFAVTGGAGLVYEGLVLLCQLPAIVVYGRALGARLPA
ncbi:MAG: hypothetical protein GWO02_06730 [Gammaproteobacteria bacterium]|nr:hypothetical protein [Gammaproteobacteria bacterium]